MVDTAGTITKAADIMKEAGAISVRAIASHCVMSGPASERVQNSGLEEWYLPIVFLMLTVALK